jgi:tetratricopeptide (TPR) repeat protein
MSGDLDAAEEAIQAAEIQGASTGQVHMLRGQLALHRGDDSRAIEHLEQAVRLMPASVAARGMLTSALATESWEQYEQVLLDLEALTPITADDYLFKGFAEFDDPIRGLKTLDEAVRLRDTAIGRALRAELRAYVAMDTANERNADLALQDAGIARGLLPGNSRVLYTNLLAEVIAANVYGVAGKDDQRKVWLETAGRTAAELEPSELLKYPCLGRLYYLEQIGLDHAALELANRAYGPDEPVWALETYSRALYGRGEWEKALMLLEGRKKRTMTLDVTHAYVTTELHNGPARAFEAYQTFAREYPSATGIWFGQSILFLLGRASDACAVARQLKRNRTVDATGWQPHFEALLAYWSDEISDDECVRLSGAGKSRQCSAHYQIALKRLAGGDRAGARRHLQMAVRTHAFVYFSWAWSRTFLARMEKDPTWPPWIPVKK